MNAEFISPFLYATINVMTTMAQLEPKPQRPALKKNNIAWGEVTGLIGMSREDCQGSLALNFSKSAILHITSQMLGEKFTAVNESVLEIAGELANIITGNVKGILEGKGYKFEMARPIMLHGLEHVIDHKIKANIIVVPFETPAGQFYVELCFESRAKI